MTPTKCPLTARGLLEAVAEFGPTPGVLCLEFDREPPTDLWDALRVLQTGVRSILTRRRWFGCSSATGHPCHLSPDKPIPDGVDLLTVEGDAKWDRIPLNARQDFPHLFAAPPTPAHRTGHVAPDKLPGFGPAR